MFVCRLVNGVRSSCDASATKRRCVSIDSSSAPSIVLNAPPSRDELVAAVCIGDALARVAGLGDPLRGAGQAPHRHERRARDERAAAPRRRDAADETRSRISCEPVERAVDVVDGANELQTAIRDRRPSIPTNGTV